MKITVSAIKADVGSIGGHIKPAQRMLDTVQAMLKESSLLIDWQTFYTGDDICLLMAHSRGADDSKIHQLAWDAFKEATEVAKEMGLYGAGQDLLKSAFSGNIKGAGPAAAEMEFEERENEPFVLFMADKTDPGAYNLPLFLAFADPMYTPGLLLSLGFGRGFRFIVQDVSYTDGDRLIELNAPEDYYELASLLRDLERYVIKEIYSRQTGEQAATVCTTRLHNIAGKYTGKDDPICLVRTQKSFPATGEILSPYVIAPFVAGFMRGSHNGPLMPVKLNSQISYFDGPPIVSGAALCIHEGKLTEAADVFDQPLWDYVRSQVSRKAIEIRRQGFFGNAMLPMSELEYGGILERIKELDKKFFVAKPSGKPRKKRK